MPDVCEAPTPIYTPRWLPGWPLRSFQPGIVRGGGAAWGPEAALQRPAPQPQGAFVPCLLDLLLLSVVAIWVSYTVKKVCLREEAAGVPTENFTCINVGPGRLGVWEKAGGRGRHVGCCAPLWKYQEMGLGRWATGRGMQLWLLSSNSVPADWCQEKIYQRNRVLRSLESRDFGGRREMGVNNIYASFQLRESPCDHFCRTPAAPAFVNSTTDTNKTHALTSHRDVTFWTSPECGHVWEMWKLTTSGKTLPLSSVASSVGCPGGAERECRPLKAWPSLSVLGGEGEGRENREPSLFWGRCNQMPRGKSGSQIGWRLNMNDIHVTHGTAEGKTSLTGSDYSSLSSGPQSLRKFWLSEPKKSVPLEFRLVSHDSSCLLLLIATAFTKRTDLQT